MTAVAPQIISSDDRWYLEHVPARSRGEEDGCIIVSHTMGKGHWVDEAARTPQEALAVVRRHAADPRTVGIFTSQARMRPHDRQKRSADLACTFGGVWLDLDAKDFGKPEESIVDKFERIVKELKAFRTAVGLPFPSVLVWSGGGMHAYWLTTTPMSGAQWTRLSTGLRDAARQHGLRADLQCTTDAARVLRVPGTQNRKPEYGDGLPAEVIHPEDRSPPVRYTLEDLAPLSEYASAPRPVAGNGNVFHLPQFPRREPITAPSDLRAGIQLNVDEIRSAVAAIPVAAVASEGDWVRFARALAHSAYLHPACTEQLWAILDNLSQRAPGYDSADNLARWERYLREAGSRQQPITIATVFAMARSAGWRAAVTSTGNDEGSAVVTLAGNNANSEAITSAGNGAGSETVTSAGNGAGSETVTSAGNDAGSEAVTSAGNDAGSEAITSAGNDTGSEAITSLGNISSPPPPHGGPEVTQSGNIGSPPPSKVADYVPGNEDACRQALDGEVSDDPNTFRIGSLLVILRIPCQTDLPDSTYWSADFPGTTLATSADIMERAERIVWRRRGKSGWLVRAHPPAAFINHYLPQMRDRYGARPLRGIARVPVIAPSGEVRFPQGYDPQTGLFHDRTPILELADNPSHADAAASAQILLEPFSLYKFEDGIGGPAIMLGALLTALERPFLRTAPMLVIRSSMPGTGKGLIVRCLVWLAYGTLPVLMTWGNSKEEFEKRLASILITSPAAFSIDNANGMQIEGELLESIITEGSADIRLLGRSEMVHVQNSSLVTLTGNNPSITGDMARRTLPIDIVPRSVDPERDRYPFDPFEVVQARRTEFLTHAFTIMRAYRLAGMPESGLRAVGSFDAWSRRIRDLVYWLNGHDISEVFRRNKAEDPRRQGDGSLLAALHGHFGSKSFKSGEPIAVCQRALDARRPQSSLPAPAPAEQALADAIEDVFGSRGINAKLFGHWARRIRGAHIDGFVLDVQHDPSTNSNLCTVCRSP